MTVDEEQKYDYDIALSFAGEDRATVEKLAEALVEKGVEVFYDGYETAQLWGKDLYQHLQTVYKDKARYCVVFVSANYAKKLWTRHELKQAQARAFRESHEYILPVRLDDTEIPGLNATTGYVDLRKHSIAELRTVILEKLYGKDAKDEDLPELTWKGEMVIHRGQEVARFWPEKIVKAQSMSHYVVRVERIRYGDEQDHWAAEMADRQPCGDCAVIKGEWHVSGCDVEQCPLCRGPALGCECIVGVD